MLDINTVLSDVDFKVSELEPGDYRDSLRSRQVKALAMILVEGYNKELADLEKRMGEALAQLRDQVSTHGHDGFRLYGGIGPGGH